MKAVTDICSDLHSELRHLKGGEIWVCTYSLHGDAFEALFKPFKDKFRFHILVDCGGIQPASMTDYGRNLSQIYHSTLHAKLILIKSHFVRNHNSLAYFLTGNIRQSLVNDENYCIKIGLDSHITTTLLKWLKGIQNNKKDRPFLLSYDVNTECQKHVECTSLGTGIIRAIQERKTKLTKLIFMAPWGCQATVRNFCAAFPTINKIDLYAGCNVNGRDRQNCVWVATVPTQKEFEIKRFLQSHKTKKFIHAKTALFRGIMNGQEHSFLYAGSGNFTMSGFWKQQQHLAAPNIECGVLFQGTDNMAGKLSGWYNSQIIGNVKSRWKYIAPPKTETIPPGNHIDNIEEFTEDDKQNGFDRRRLAKLITSAIQKRSLREILIKICKYPNKSSHARALLARKLGTECKEKIIIRDNPSTLERHKGHTLIGITIDTDDIYGIYIITKIPFETPITEDEEAKLIELLADFNKADETKGGRKSRKDRKDPPIKEKNNINVRFPYRDIFTLKERLLKKESGADEFRQFLLRKVEILNLLKGSTNKDIPLWWKPLFERLIQESKPGQPNENN